MMTINQLKGPQEDGENGCFKLSRNEILSLFAAKSSSFLLDILEDKHTDPKKEQATSKLESILLDTISKILSLYSSYANRGDNDLLLWVFKTLYPSVNPTFDEKAFHSALLEFECKVRVAGMLPGKYHSIEPLIFAIIDNVENVKDILEEDKEVLPLVLSWYKSYKSGMHLPKHLKNIVSENKLSCQSYINNGRNVNDKNTINISFLKRAASLPDKQKENILVTSALPYVNNSPHIGNIIGCVLGADAYTRFCRARGKNCLFICGTDEYGTATEVRAFQENISCKELCDRYFLVHKKVYDWFEIDFDAFGRTSTDYHTELTQKFYSDNKKNNMILKKDVEQLYCNLHEKFLADRFIAGTCPNCKFHDARGDQCDQCGNVFDTAVSIIDPKCKVDGSTPIVKTTKHLFLNLESSSDELKTWVEKASKEGSWSSNSISITNSWFNVGLKPRCITRDLSWGVPVNEDGYDEKVFYVWFDACIGYPSITADYMGENWKKWWLNPNNVKLYQFMGKDNSSFHTIMFPSMQLGSKENWTMLHHIATTEFLQYENGKFSKTRGTGVFGDDLIKLDIKCSVWRYYLLANRPEKSDVKFLWDSFANANNNELLASLGNLNNRVLKFIAANFASTIPKYSIEGPNEQKLIESVNEIITKYIDAFEKIKIRNAVKYALEVTILGNKYLQESGLNNNLFKYDYQACSNVVGVVSNLLYLIGALFYPIIPSTSIDIYKQLNVPPRKIEDVWTCSDILPGHQISETFHLFTALSIEEIQSLKEKFGSFDGKDKPVVV